MATKGARAGRGRAGGGGAARGSSGRKAGARSRTAGKGTGGRQAAGRTARPSSRRSAPARTRGGREGKITERVSKPRRAVERRAAGAGARVARRGRRVETAAPRRTAATPRRRSKSSARGAAEMARFRELREMLEEKRREVLSSIQRSRMTGMEVRHEAIPEMGDFVSASVEKEQVFEMGQTGVETLREVEDALARLQGGTYGVCECCSDRITITRLKAIPFARLCVACQEKEEGGRPG